MSAELAVIHVLKNTGFPVAVKVYPVDIPQKITPPVLVVREQSNDPSDTKDGPSTLDVQRVQVLAYFNEWNEQAYDIMDKVRHALDRLPEGTYNGVTVQSIRFEDSDQFKEQVIDKDIFVKEHIYKVRVKR